MERVTLLGSTGSIGEQTLDIVRRCNDRFQIDTLVAHSRWQRLAEQARSFGARAVVIGDKSHYAELKAALDSLSPDEKQIVLLSVIGRYKSSEIAEIMEMKHSVILQFCDHRQRRLLHIVFHIILHRREIESHAIPSSGNIRRERIEGPEVITITDAAFKNCCAGSSPIPVDELSRAPGSHIHNRNPVFSAPEDISEHIITRSS